jgi:hypothetical protein
MKKRWLCRSCKDIVVSDSTKRHQMDVCKCGKTKVDLEEGYVRYVGQKPETWVDIG